MLGRPELDYLCKLAREACKDAQSPEDAEKAIQSSLKDKDLKQNIEALWPGKLEAGLGAALFGRMVTGDILSRTDGALHVAHSFTVHAQQSESDYFSAIDDLAREEGEQGSGHINASELTSGLFYGYVVVDLRQLSHNLGDDSELAGEVIERFVQMVATVEPRRQAGVDRAVCLQPSDAGRERAISAPYPSKCLPRRSTDPGQPGRERVSGSGQASRPAR